MNIVNLESIINTAGQIDRIQGAVASSICWSLGLKFAGTYATIVRLSDTEDPVFGQGSRVSADRKAEMLAKHEHLLEDLRNALAWAASFTKPEYRPTGIEIVNLAATPRQSDTPAQAVIDAFAEIAGIDRNMAEEAMAMGAEQRNKMDQLQANAVAQQKQYVATLIDNALDAPIDDVDLPDAVAVGIARRLAEKLHLYALQRTSWAADERRPQRMVTLLSDARILQALSVEAEKLEQQLQAELDGATERAPVEEAAAEVA